MISYSFQEFISALFTRNFTFANRNSESFILNRTKSQVSLKAMETNASNTGSSYSKPNFNRMRFLERTHLLFQFV